MNHYFYSDGEKQNGPFTFEQLKNENIEKETLIWFEDLDEENVEELLMGNRLADGGAAMTAYAMMQFTDMSHGERERIIQGLLKYCELDTLAMVFLWEYWNHFYLI